MPEPHRLELSIALHDNNLTRPILDGKIAPQGVNLVCTAVHGSEMFWRQLKFADFDVSEMSLSSLMIAASRGDRTWVGLPVYTMRSFFHTGIMVTERSGITRPEDLKGKRVGVPEYQQTSAIWSRGILQREFGVHPRDVEWFMERTPEKSHGGSTGFAPPEGVRLNRIPPSTNIGEMMLKDELDATLLYLNTRNLVDRSRVDLAASSQVRPLFPDAAAEKKRYYDKTGMLPINHAMVIRRSLLERHPFLALNIYSAFVAARDYAKAEAEALLTPFAETGVLAQDPKMLLAADPAAYGMKAGRPVLEMVADFVHEQGLTPHRVKLEDIFAPSTLDV